MKRTAILLIAVFALAGVLTATAATTDTTFTVPVISTATNSQTFTIRGLLEGIAVDVPSVAATTGTVVVATADETVFTLTATADGVYRPRAATHSTAGAAATYDGTRAVLERIALAGPVTVTVTGVSGAGTNYVVRLIYEK